jgi:hypothetical protein
LSKDGKKREREREREREKERERERKREREKERERERRIEMIFRINLKSFTRIENASLTKIEVRKRKATILNEPCAI